VFSTAAGEPPDPQPAWRSTLDRRWIDVTRDDSSTSFRGEHGVHANAATDVEKAHTLAQ